jgi:ribosome biogenesis ATPase
LASGVDLHSIASDERCRNFSGADLSSLVREAGVVALKKKFFHGQNIKDLDASGYYEQQQESDEVEVTQEDFLKALSSINPSVSDKDRARYERLNKRMGWSVISEADEEKEGALNNGGRE